MTTTWICVCCQSTFTCIRRGGSPPRYCSDTCRRAFAAARARYTPVAPLPCKACGGPVTAGQGTRYCSPNCLATRRTGRFLDQFTCIACERTWERKPTRGRVPKLCPTCRELPALKYKHVATCAWCGKTTLMRRDAQGCSRACGNALRYEQPPLTELSWQQCTACLAWMSRGCRFRYETCSRSCESAATEVLKPRQTPALRECPTCGLTFETHQSQARYCSKRCNRKAHRLRRRVLEAGSFGDWRWSDFMRMARRFDYCCAYCGIKPDRLDPDHVVPLSKGGPNTLSNLLPACPACNCDKQAYSLTEWADARSRRRLPPIRTAWPQDDARYWHLTSLTEPNPEGIEGWRGPLPAPKSAPERIPLVIFPEFPSLQVGLLFDGPGGQ